MLPPDLFLALARAGVETRADPAARILYSTDASQYQIEPLGVAFPRNGDELAACVQLAAEHHTPILARGAGSSLAGQAVGRALVLVCSRYLTHFEIDPETRSAIAEPGAILAALNKAAAPHGLQFGPDPASAERATIGGCIANNASGAHSIVHGMTADHLLAADVVLADGSMAVFSDQLSVISEQFPVASNQYSVDVERSTLNKLTAFAQRIRSEHAETIRAGWPRVWRNASGYNLNYLLPWFPTAPPFFVQHASRATPRSSLSTSHIPLPTILAGSEGTLAVIRRATLRLVPLPRHTLLAVLAYPSIAEACDAAPALLEHSPSAIELIPRNLIRLARSVPAYAGQIANFGFRNSNSDLLIVEFSGDDPAGLKARAQKLGAAALLAEDAAAQKQIWNVRKVGLGLLASQPGDDKGATFIEDISVPVERLGEYIREMERILDAHGTRGDFYGHASAGVLHMRPHLNIKTKEGVAAMRALAEESVKLISRLGGVMTGEHGDGLARSEFIERIYGPEITALFRELKRIADPQGILNPGKIVDPAPMHENLRYGEGYRTRAWAPRLDFTRNGGAEGKGGLIGAVEMCNGAGVCRKSDGVMCPSFQATQDEMHSTRGRANLLRAMMAGNVECIPINVENAVAESLDLCLACKGCKAECPSAVDMAKLKYEFLHQYYSTHRRKLRDYLFAFIGSLAPLGAVFGPLTNFLIRQPLFSRVFGLAVHRPFPRFSFNVPPFDNASTGSARRLRAGSSTFNVGKPTVLFLADTFNHYFYPQTEATALRVLAKAGCVVKTIPIMGAGRTLISKGFLDHAKRHAARLVETIRRLDPAGQLPVIGLEPSEIYTLRDEFLDLFPNNDDVSRLASRAWMIDEFLLRQPNFEFRISNLEILLHAHCYQKAQPPAPDGLPSGSGATAAMLKAAGYAVKMIEDGCCGMAGAFGYEAEHYELSLKIGELALLPAVRTASQNGQIIAAPGVSCRAQIEDGSGVPALHPIELIDRVIV